MTLMDTRPAAVPATIPDEVRRRRALADAEALAVALCRIYGGTQWRAELRGRDARRQVAVAIDRRELVVLTHWHLGSRVDRWMISVNGRAIPYRPDLGEWPGSVPAVARAVWLYRTGADAEPCDEAEHCPATGVIATYGRTVCASHARPVLYHAQQWC
jgi:hypothetical protein